MHDVYIVEIILYTWPDKSKYWIGCKKRNASKKTGEKSKVGSSLIGW